MRMTIEEAILYMELYKRNLLDSVSDLDKDIEAYDTAIDTMRKYQKIEQIMKKRRGKYFIEIVQEIKEVLEDGNNHNHHASNAQ